MRVVWVLCLVVLGREVAAADPRMRSGPSIRFGSTFGGRDNAFGAGFGASLGHRFGRYKIDWEVLYLDFNDSANESLGYGLRLGLVHSFDILRILEDERMLVVYVEGGAMIAHDRWRSSSTHDTSEPQGLAGFGLEIASKHIGWFIGGRAAFGDDDELVLTTCRGCRVITSTPREDNSIRAILLHTGWSVTW